MVRRDALRGAAAHASRSLLHMGVGGEHAMTSDSDRSFSHSKLQEVSHLFPPVDKFLQMARQRRRDARNGVMVTTSSSDHISMTTVISPEQKSPRRRPPSKLSVSGTRVEGQSRRRDRMDDEEMINVYWNPDQSLAEQASAPSHKSRRSRSRSACSGRVSRSQSMDRRHTNTPTMLTDSIPLMTFYSEEALDAVYSYSERHQFTPRNAGARQKNHSRPRGSVFRPHEPAHSEVNPDVLSTTGAVNNTDGYIPTGGKAQDPINVYNHTADNTMEDGTTHLGNAEGGMGEGERGPVSSNVVRGHFSATENATKTILSGERKFTEVVRFAVDTNKTTTVSEPSEFHNDTERLLKIDTGQKGEDSLGPTWTEPVNVDNANKTVTVDFDNDTCSLMSEKEHEDDSSAWSVHADLGDSRLDTLSVNTDTLNAFDDAAIESLRANSEENARYPPVSSASGYIYQFYPQQYRSLGVNPGIPSAPFPRGAAYGSMRMRRPLPLPPPFRLQKADMKSIYVLGAPCTVKKQACCHLFRPISAEGLGALCPECVHRASLAQRKAQPYGFTFDEPQLDAVSDAPISLPRPNTASHSNPDIDDAQGSVHGHRVESAGVSMHCQQTPDLGKSSRLNEDAFDKFRDTQVYIRQYGVTPYRTRRPSSAIETTSSLTKGSARHLSKPIRPSTVHNDRRDREGKWPEPLDYLEPSYTDTTVDDLSFIPRDSTSMFSIKPQQDRPHSGKKRPTVNMYFRPKSCQGKVHRQAPKQTSPRRVHETGNIGDNTKNLILCSKGWIETNVFESGGGAAANYFDRCQSHQAHTDDPHTTWNILQPYVAGHDTDENPDKTEFERDVDIAKQYTDFSDEDISLPDARERPEPISSPESLRGRLRPQKHALPVELTSFRPYIDVKGSVHADSKLSPRRKLKGTGSGCARTPNPPRYRRSFGEDGKWGRLLPSGRLKGSTQVVDDNVQMCLAKADMDILNASVEKLRLHTYANITGGIGKKPRRMLTLNSKYKKTYRRTTEEEAQQACDLAAALESKCMLRETTTTSCKEFHKLSNDRCDESSNTPATDTARTDSSHENADMSSSECAVSKTSSTWPESASNSDTDAYVLEGLPVTHGKNRNENRGGDDRLGRAHRSLSVRLPRIVPADEYQPLGTASGEEPGLSTPSVRNVFPNACLFRPPLYKNEGCRQARDICKSIGGTKHNTSSTSKEIPPNGRKSNDRADSIYDKHARTFPLPPHVYSPESPTVTLPALKGMFLQGDVRLVSSPKSSDRYLCRPQSPTKLLLTREKSTAGNPKPVSGLADTQTSHLPKVSQGGGTTLIGDSIASHGGSSPRTAGSATRVRLASLGKGLASSKADFASPRLGVASHVDDSSLQGRDCLPKLRLDVPSEGTVTLERTCTSDGDSTSIEGLSTQPDGASRRSNKIQTKRYQCTQASYPEQTNTDHGPSSDQP